MDSRNVILAAALLFALVADAHIGEAIAETGVASWYGPGLCGRRTASGERFNCSELTAAHRSLRFGSHVRVVDLASGRTVVVRINDRGPFLRGRVIDLSPAAKQALGMRGGTTRVRLETANSSSRFRR
jgi:rare lipoprotein A